MYSIYLGSDIEKTRYLWYIKNKSERKNKMGNKSTKRNINNMKNIFRSGKIDDDTKNNIKLTVADSMKNNLTFIENLLFVDDKYTDSDLEEYAKAIDKEFKDKTRDSLERMSKKKDINNIKLSRKNDVIEELYNKYIGLEEKYIISKKSWALIDARIIRGENGRVVSIYDGETGKPYYILKSEEELEFDKYLENRDEIKARKEASKIESIGYSPNNIKIPPIQRRKEGNRLSYEEFNRLNSRQQQIYLKYSALEQNYKLQNDNECIIGQIISDPTTGKVKSIFDTETGREIYLLKKEEQQEYNIFKALV